MSHHQADASRQSQRSRFFMIVALLMLVVIALGFGTSFFARPWLGSEPLPTYLVAHGIAMTAWYFLLLAQTGFAAAGRINLHRRFGMAGMALAVGVVITAVIVHLQLVPRRQAQGYISSPEDLHRIAGFALDGISSLIPFVILIVLAVLLRRRPAVHKRLMFWAFVWTLAPAFSDARPLGQFLDTLVVPLLPYFPTDFIWLAALLIYDWRTLRRIHPATYIPFILLAASLTVAGWIAESATLRDLLLAYVQ